MGQTSLSYKKPSINQSIYLSIDLSMYLGSTFEWKFYLMLIPLLAERNSFGPASCCKEARLKSSLEVHVLRKHGWQTCLLTLGLAKPRENGHASSQLHSQEKPKYLAWQANQLSHDWECHDAREQRA